MFTISFTPKTKREKQLLIVAGFLALFVIIAALYMLYGGSASRVILQRNHCRKEVAELEQKVANMALYKKQIADYIKRSLPPMGTMTENRYQKIVLDEASDAGFKNAQTFLISSKSSKKGSEYQAITIKLTGESSLESLTKLMRRFNEHDLLHLIKKLTVKPLEQSNRMSIEMTVEAIALDLAKTKLEIDPNYRTEESYLENLAKQVEEINNRAFFSAYRPPAPERSEPPERSRPRHRFTEAMYTFVSAVIEVNGVSQVWIEQRLKGNKLKLVVGDKFEVDGVECFIREINLHGVKIGAMVESEENENELEEMQYTVRVGKCIDDFDEGEEHL